MFFQSKYRRYKLVLKSGVHKDVNGQVIFIPQLNIQFENFRFIPDEEQEKILGAVIEQDNSDFWKVTDEELKIAKEYTDEMNKVSEKFAEKKELLKKMTVPKKGVTVARGAVSTDMPARVEEEIVIPKEELEFSTGSMPDKVEGFPQRVEKETVKSKKKKVGLPPLPGSEMPKRDYKNGVEANIVAKAEDDDTQAAVDAAEDMAEEDPTDAGL